MTVVNASIDLKDSFWTQAVEGLFVHDPSPHIWCSNSLAGYETVSAMGLW